MVSKHLNQEISLYFLPFRELQIIGIPCRPDNPVFRQLDYGEFYYLT